MLNHCISTVYQLQIQEPLNVTSPKTNMLNPKKEGLECLEDGSSFLFRGPFSGSTKLVFECLLFLVWLHGVDVFQQLSFLCSKLSGQGYRFRLLSMFHGNHVALGIFDKYPIALCTKTGVLKEWDLTVSTWNIVITYSWDQESFGGTSKSWCFWLYWILNLLFYLYTYRS